jgi:hypothetical protein
MIKNSKIVLTSYNQIAAEQAAYEKAVAAFEARRVNSNAPHMNRSDIPLIHIRWGRVVFDQRHDVKNQKTISFSAANGPEATTRILVTGTPFSNDCTYDEIGARRSNV